jgi:F0F1-type ATP synthase assembly protein I
MEKTTPKFFSAIYLGLELGFLIAVPLIIFLLGGLWLDKKMQTTPLFLILGLLLNFGITMIEVKKLILPFLEKRSQGKTEIINKIIK